MEKSRLKSTMRWLRVWGDEEIIHPGDVIYTPAEARIDLRDNTVFLEGDQDTGTRVSDWYLRREKFGLPERWIIRHVDAPKDGVRQKVAMNAVFSERIGLP